MKKTLLSIFAVIALLTAANAQPTLTGANMNPVHGDGFYGHYVDTNVSKGPSGANVTWNLASVTELALDSTLAYNCSATPHCSSFPGSNIAELNFGDYIYYNTSATSQKALGAYSLGTVYLFDNTIDIMRYPFNYTNAYVDTLHFGSASYDDFYTEIDSFIYDGYGTLVLPTGTDTGVVRVRNITYSHDSSSGSVTDYRYETYNWYKPGFHNPIFTIQYDTAGSTTGEQYVYDASYYTLKPSSLGVEEVNILNATMQVYPNPASDVLNIKFKTPYIKSATIVITDLVGRVIATIRKDDIVNGVAEITYPVTGMPEGSYIVQLHSEAGSVSQKFTVSK